MSEASDFSENIPVSSEDEMSRESSGSDTDDSSSDKEAFMDSVRTSVPRSRKTKKYKNKVRYVYAPMEGESDKRISPKTMTIYEYARMIGERAEMISKGGKIHPKYQNVDTVDLLKIAQMELDDRSIPFPLVFHRPIDNPTNAKIIEVFNPHEPGFFTHNYMLTKSIDKYTPDNAWRVNP